MTAEDVEIEDDVASEANLEENVPPMDHPSNRQNSAASPMLSKSWSISSRHIPTFTGGKISYSCTTGGLLNDDDADSHGNEFLLLPVGGDLAVVDARRGTMVGSVRGLVSSSEENLKQDNEDDGVDMDSITTHALSYNDQILMTCSRNGVMRQYSFGPEKAVGKIVDLTKNWGKSGHTLPINHMEFHVSDVFLATGSVDGTARVWDVRGGFVTHVFRPYQSTDGGGSGRLSVTALEWMPDIHQLLLAVGRDDGSIAIHSLREEKEVILLHEHLSAVTVMRWTTPLDTTKMFVTAGRDSVINLWKIEESSKKKKGKKREGYTRLQTLPCYEQIEAMLFLSSPNPNLQQIVLATVGGKGRVRIWSTSVDSPELVLMDEQPIDQAFGEKEGGYTNLIMKRKKDESTGEYSEQLIVADSEHNISFLSLDQGKRLSTVRTIVGHNDDILDLKIIPNGPEMEASSQKIVVVTNSPRVRIFDLSTFSCHVLDRHSATVLCVDVSPCGRYISTCGKDREMRIWEVASMNCVAVAVGHAEAVGSTALSRQLGRYDVTGKAATNGGGSFAVTVSVDRTLKRWNLPGSETLNAAANGGKEIALKAFMSARAHEKDINVVVVAPNDSLIATGSQDKTVKLWSAIDLQLRATLSGHRRGVWDCQFSPHDRVLATASADRTIKLWSLSNYSCVRTFQGHTSSVLRVRFLSYGMQLASSGSDGLVKVWTIRTNECEATMDGHNDKVWALDLVPGGKTMVSGGADSRILVWTDTTQQENEAKHVLKEEALMLDQKLANHLRHKEYREALEITLELDKPHHAHRVFSALIESGSTNGVETLKSLVRSWSKDKIVLVLRYCREWNTLARNAHVAQLVIRAIFSTISVNDLVSMEGVPEIMAGIMPYTERHFERLDRLHESSFLLDFVLTSMGSIRSDQRSDDFDRWESSCKLVLPPANSDGRIQVGGKTIVGNGCRNNEEDEEDEIMTEGESSDDSDSI